jgi:arabinosyltransferase C
MANEPTHGEQLASSSVVDDADTKYRTARVVAVVAGLLGALLALATPLLPVKQTTAQLNWPQNGVLSSVAAPLIGYVATDLNISIPCQAAAGLDGPGKTVLLSTVPKQAPKAVDRGLLIERVNDDLVLIVRNVAPARRSCSPRTPTGSPPNSSGSPKVPTPSIPVRRCAVSAADTTFAPRSSVYSPI